ncbi:hypothetical protein GFS31_05090 [Leptolyngbya sp. BL0902]|nr:hypothetical protein [Leptolyngbya sp. BL0902]QQE63839.1 hypothetical protein GFS31_05090 [Leptolyngbya sp. BL0902]
MKIQSFTTLGIFWEVACRFYRQGWVCWENYDHRALDFLGSFLR